MSDDLRCMLDKVYIYTQHGEMHNYLYRPKLEAQSIDMLTKTFLCIV